MNNTLAEQFRHDPRVAEAKKLILEALNDYSKQITGLRPAQNDLKESYSKLLEDFAQYRGGKLWYPFVGSGLGNGALVELADGSVKYDFITGIGVHYFGHSHPSLVEAAIDGSLGNTAMQGHLQQNTEQYALCKLLVEQSGLDHCFLTTSGAMANENAIKILFQKNAPASRILAFENCFMGRTWSCSQITDKASGRVGLPPNVLVDYIPFYNHKKPEESRQEALRVLKRHLERYPGQYAFMAFELVQGEGGCMPGERQFFTDLMELLKENKIAIFADEVQTFGRTQNLFAYQTFGLEKYIDVVTIGKLSQVCATLYKADFKPKPGLLSQTFTASTSTLFVAKTLINQLISGNFFGTAGKNTAIEKKFHSCLNGIAKRHPQLIEGPWGIGAMVGFTPYGGDPTRVGKLSHALFEAGVLSFTAGSKPMRIRFLVPAGAVTDQDIDAVSKILEETLVKCNP